MFELILTTIKDNLIKVKQDIIENVTFQIDRDTAEIRSDLLEIKKILKAQTVTTSIMRQPGGRKENWNDIRRL